MADGNISKDILHEAIVDDFESMLELDQGKGSLCSLADHRSARSSG